MTVAHTSASSVMAALELDASVMEALASHVAAAQCPDEHLQPSSFPSATCMSGVRSSEFVSRWTVGPVRTVAKLGHCVVFP